MFPATIPSPPQGVWSLGPVPLRAYALAIIAGIVVAAIWGNRRWVARGGRPGTITDLAVWMVPFGLVGGRLYHVITNPELYFAAGRNPWNAFAIWNGGLGIWGAIALGGLGAYIGARRYRIPFGAVADALAPAIVLGQAIGRVGNYFNQELFGGPTTVPWALDVYLRTPGGVPGAAESCGSGEFPTDWIQADPTVLCGTYHPTFLYEILWNLAVMVLVVWADRRFRLGHGRAFALYVAGYTAGRAWIEMMRIDYANHILGLRVNVFVAVAVFLAAVIYLIATRQLTREDPAAVWGRATGSDADSVIDDASHGDSTAAGEGAADTDDKVDGAGAATDADDEKPAAADSDSTADADGTAAAAGTGETDDGPATGTQSGAAR